MPPRRRKAEPVPVTTDTPAKARTLTRPDAPATPPAEPAVAPAKPVYKQRSVYLSDQVWERARAAIAYVQYFEIDNEPDTLAALLGDALVSRLDAMEAKYNDGEPFKKVRKLPTGPGRAGVDRLTVGSTDDE